MNESKFGFIILPKEKVDPRSYKTAEKNFTEFNS